MPLKQPAYEEHTRLPRCHRLGALLSFVQYQTEDGKKCCMAQRLGENFTMETEAIVKLLRIDSSARNNSISRQLTGTFVEAWKRKHPFGEVKERDLASTQLPLLTSEWSGVFADPAKMTAAQKQYLALSDTLTAEILEADLIVIGAPMHNFTISWPLKAWIDQVVRPGKTVSYSTGRPKGLLNGKKTVIITARGGHHQPNASAEGVDFMESYLRRVLEFIGLTDVTFIQAENQSRLAQAEASRSAAIHQIHTVVEQTSHLPLHELAPEPVN